MGTDILPGHTYTDGEFVNGPSLTEHVSEAIIKPSFYSSKNSKSPVVLTDEFLIRDTVADQYQRVSLATLQTLMVGPGGVIQTSYAEYTANTSFTAMIPSDDTIPQNTEGTEILTANITPTSSASKILVNVQGLASCNNVNNPIIAIFRDAAASALVSQLGYIATANEVRPMVLTYLDSPSTTSSITYRLRVGPGFAGTLRMNGTTVQRYLGGTMRTTLTLQEIKQ